MKSILNVVKKLSRRIEEEEKRTRYLRDLRDTITPQLDGLPRSPSVAKKIEWLTAAIVDLEKRIAEFKAILLTCRIELCEWLMQKISDAEVCSVLFNRYGLLKKFSAIAMELNYSESVIFRLHRLGLKFLGVQGSFEEYDFE